MDIYRAAIFGLAFMLPQVSWADCSITEITQLRQNALSDYSSGNIQQAEATLTKYYSDTCGYYELSKTKDEIFQQGLWLISDLMLYRRKLDNPLGCLALENDLYNSRMISDPSRHGEKVNKAIETNITQCKAMLASQYQDPIACPIDGYGYMAAIPQHWEKQDEIYYEIACVGFVANSEDLIGGQRDGPKLQSEGLQSVARLEVLYVANVTENENSDAQSRWLRTYDLDELYIADEKGDLWGEFFCYGLGLKFGDNVGVIYLSGSSSYCHGGSAAIINDLVIKLAFPFNAQIMKEYWHTYK